MRSLGAKLAIGGVAALLTLGPLLGAGPLTGTAEARDQGVFAVLEPGDDITREYTPIPARYPQDGAHPFAYFRPPMCRVQVYCDTHELDFLIPHDYTEIWGIEVTLSWEGTDTNQLTLHAWGDDGPATGASLGPCPHPRHEDCMGEHPILFRMVEPAAPGAGIDDPEDEDVEDPRMWLTVVNSELANFGYSIRVRWFELDLGEGPQLRDVERGGDADFVGPPPPPPSRPQTPDDLYAFEEGHEDERPPILVPGVDGELTEFEAPLIAAGTIEDDAGSSGVNPWITAVVAVPILGGVAFYLIRRRRRAEAS